MKSSRPAGTGGSPWWRFLGYGGALLLVVAAIGVLLLPLLDDPGGSRAAVNPTPGQVPQGQVPGQVPGTVPTNPAPQTVPPGQPSGQPSGAPQQPPGDDGSGPQIPQPNGGGSGGTPCADGVAIYRPGAGGLEVVVKPQDNVAARVLVTLRGKSPQQQMEMVRKGQTRTFSFAGVMVTEVESVTLTTVAPGGGGGATCAARPGA
ncbi:hypothetical protein [Actinomadura flavalba]|uniref:hypothetical protein n=1 Tax=Actinomadura flavalba TaxID=1120938 RepID=UPI00039E8783|nr:hypothetical protein [Actinomadura flavalba]